MMGSVPQLIANRRIVSGSTYREDESTPKIWYQKGTDNQFGHLKTDSSSGNIMSENFECIRTDNDWNDSHMQLRAGFLMKYYSASEKTRKLW